MTQFVYLTHFRRKGYNTPMSFWKKQWNMLFPRIRQRLSGALWYHLALDGALLLGVIAAGLWFWSCAVKDDPRASVTLAADGETRSFLLAANEENGTQVKDLLNEIGLTLNEGDALSVETGALIEDGMQIALERAFPVAVRSQGKVNILYTTGGTVGDALRMAGVQYDTQDEINRLTFEDLTAGMKIIHVDVATEYTTANKVLAYKENVVYDEDVYNDTNPVLVQAGSDGTKLVTQRVVIKDGVEVSREVVNQLVLTPATDEIIKKGSKIHYQTKLTGEYRIYKPAPEAGKDGWVEMKMDYITAYCTGSRTATGTKPRLGTIAVNPHYIPYGTQIYVKGYGYGVARDTGAFRKYTNSDGSLVNQLDLFMNTEKECNRWGRKRNVVVLVKLG